MAETLFPLSVVNSDPKLIAFLESASTDLTTAFPLSDWLADRDDPRAEAVLDLAGVRCVIPDCVPEPLEGFPMGCGQWWAVFRNRHRVTAKIYPGTRLALLLSSAGQTTKDIENRLPLSRQTPERLRAAFEACRRTLLLGLFDLPPDHFSYKLEVFFEPRMKRVRWALDVCGESAVSWLLELRKINPDRYERILKHIWSRPSLHWIGISVITADIESNDA